MKPYKIIRYIEMNQLFELFFLSSILTILGIRIYLLLTGYPQIAFGGFHIAHMLWGGLMMTLSIFGFMIFLNDDFKPFLSILGGVGFGFFIDELGKYITKDNNYHYQPTFALIYIIFIGLYILYKNVARKDKFTQDEYVVNAAEKLKEIIIHDLDKDEQEKALTYVQLSKKNDAITNFLRTSFSEIENIPPKQVGMYLKLKRFLDFHYRQFISRAWFLDATIALFLIRSLADLFIGSTSIHLFTTQVLNGSLIHLLTTRGNILLFIQCSTLIIQSLFTIMGAITIRKSRKQGYVFFRNALLISIFILEVFSYYTNPFLALITTTIDLFLLSILNFTITEEEHLKVKSA